MHILTILRMYLGISQATLARQAGITQPDLSEMETLTPYGHIDKYQRVARALELPVDPIMKNEPRRIPLSFFKLHPPQEYLPLPKGNTLLRGRKGEDLIFAREQARLMDISPVLSKLVLPLYKMKGQRIGCDIISFDESGTPLCLEVKTSADTGNVFQLTKNELDYAHKLTEDGTRYIITYISGWGSAKQQVRDIPFEEFVDSHDISPVRFYCAPKKELTRPHITGFAYYRRLRGLKEREIAEALELSPHKWSLYETGKVVPPVPVIMKASDFLDASVDHLLATYEVNQP